MSPSATPPAGRLVVVPVRLPADYGRLEEFRRWASAGEIGGLLLFGGDMDLTPRFLARIREASPHPLLVMSDVERGVGQQVDGGLRFPPPMALGALRDPAAAYALGAATALDCRRAGIDMALAPVLDLYNEPRNPILGTRAFGEDPELVSLLGLAWIEGCQEEGVLACAKHFPGHGRTLADSHDDLPRVDATEKELRTRDLVPFARAAAGGVAAVMTAHVAYDAFDPPGKAEILVPATVSKRILGGILRGEFGYDGLVMTDALIMEGVRRSGEGAAAVASLEAGCDILLCPTDHREILAAVGAAGDAGRLPADRIAASVARVDRCLAALGERPTAREVGEMDEYRAYAMAQAAVTTLRDPGRLLPLAPVPAAETLAVILDDDDRPGREAPVLERRADFGAGILRKTAKSRELDPILEEARGLRRILVFVYGDVRAWKGRVGLGPELACFRDLVASRHGSRTILVSFGSPLLAGQAPGGSAVCAWDDAPGVQRAALDLLLSGRAPTGRPPFGPDPLEGG